MTRTIPKSLCWWAIGLCGTLAVGGVGGCSRVGDKESAPAAPVAAAPASQPAAAPPTVPPAVPSVTLPIEPTAEALALAVQRHLGRIKKCWKKTDARFTGETQTLRFVIAKGAASVAFVDPNDDAHPLGTCIKGKLSDMTFTQAPPMTLEIPVRFSERRGVSGSTAPPPAPTQGD